MDGFRIWQAKERKRHTHTYTITFTEIAKNVARQKGMERSKKK